MTIIKFEDFTGNGVVSIFVRNSMVIHTALFILYSDDLY